MRTLLTLALASVSLFAETTTWKIDQNHSAASFGVKHMMVSTVRGTMGKVTGTVVCDSADVSKSAVNAEIDVTGLSTQNENRDKHLKSGDFFDVEKFPKMTFQSTKIWKAGSGLKMAGNLTMHGVTKEVVFDVDGPSPSIAGQGGSKRSGASATAKINRKDFGLTWNRALEAGGVTVGDEVAITLDVEMTSGGPAAKQ